MKSLKKILITACFMLSTTLLPIQQANAIFGFGIVFDPTNYGQNLLTAANTLRQINNQIIQLRNEARMLVNQASNLTRLPTSVATNLQSSLYQMDNLIRNANGIAYQISAIDAEYRRLYPEQYVAATTSSRIFQDGQEAWKQARLGYKHSLHVQAETVNQVRDDRALLDRLIMKSQGAVGNLQVAQAGNQLTALSTKQTMQLQTLLASSARADALDRAAKLAAKEQARAHLNNFLGDNQAYTP